MKDPKKLKPFFYAIGYGTLASSLIIGHQISSFYKKIDRAVSSDVLSLGRMAPTYIYIEDPFLQEEIEAGFTLSRERLKLTRFHKWLYNKIEESFIFRNWYSYKKNLPWRFLKIAQDENQSYRNRAVRSLASMNNLSDADYQQLAQACDLRTAVGLARSTKNVKFLLNPPHFKTEPNKKYIIKELNNLFLAIDAESKHPCLQYFVQKVIHDALDIDNKVSDDDFRFNFGSQDFIPVCLEALLHHSWTTQNAKRKMVCNPLQPLSHGWAAFFIMGFIAYLRVAFKKRSRKIVRHKGLPILIEIYKLLTSASNTDPKSIETLIVLSKLVSNISSCTDCAQDFFVSGWIKVLALLSQHKDIRVAAPAQKALLNFDKDDPAQKDLHYSRKVFPLHPVQRTLSRPKLDVVFIHGLLGGVFITWKQRDFGHCGLKSPLELLAPKKVPSFPTPNPGLTASEDQRERLASYQKTKPLDQDFFVDVSDLDNWEKITNSYEFVLSDIPIDSNTNISGPFYGSHSEKDCDKENFSKCWPKDWLPEDCPEVRVLGINYETNLSNWTATCPVLTSSGTLRERSSFMMESLRRAGVGKRPVVWVGHSMGGLLVKSLLTLARNSNDPGLRSLFEQTKGIVFYSTPHKGSHLAALNPTSQMIVWPSVEVQELRENSPGLLKLHQEFLKLMKERHIKVISFAERESTYITSLKFELRFVDSKSADPDVGESYGIPLDHLAICKPSGRQSFIYQKVKLFIKDIIKGLEEKKS